ncbi:T6SS immunity protein Tli4 family protein, partial [Burkholderia sp. SIMBA_042]|uniref:T6SS immunity protein Tli4 family protein n=1 Tax=Burkholderia sp. SIMBA_042 TaxID=3085783 RepID=UPI00397DCCFD
MSFVTRSDDRNSASTTALEVLTNLQPRAVGEVPAEPGVCLPGVFVRTSQVDKTRIVGVSYRLKRHPDVLI